MRFAFPPQSLERFPHDGGSVISSARTISGSTATSSASIGRHARSTLGGPRSCVNGRPSQSVVLDDWVDAKSKALALQAFADDVLDGGTSNAVTMALLARQRPRFLDGSGPADGVFSDNLDEMIRWATQLDHSYVAIQGPPGTGKTHNGAHLIYALITAGQRVGITATSHVAIAHLLEKVIKVFTEHGSGGDLHAVQKPASDGTCPAGVTRAGDNAAAARPEFNLVAGTTWLFASNAMAGEASRRARR